ncbi:MAG TPA: lipoprotein signal peptidase [Bacteroidales bacterium]|nr:lipoprotein signal peptidase [Bacteroidales bacterium]
MTKLGIKKSLIPWIVVLLVLIIDQTSKILVKTNMTLGQSIAVFGDWFMLHFTENFGMAFGIEIPGEFGKLILSLIRIAALGLIGWYIVKLVRENAPTGLLVCLGLLWGGAAGNVIDSAFYGLIFSQSFFHQVATMFPEGGGYGTFLHGYVVDMFYAPIIHGTFPEWFPFKAGREFIFFSPVFNVADAAITIGVFTMLIFQKRFFHFESVKSKNSEPNTEKADITS